MINRKYQSNWSPDSGDKIIKFGATMAGVWYPVLYVVYLWITSRQGIQFNFQLFPLAAMSFSPEVKALAMTAACMLSLHVLRWIVIALRANTQKEVIAPSLIGYVLNSFAWSVLLWVGSLYFVWGLATVPSASNNHYLPLNILLGFAVLTLLLQWWNFSYGYKLIQEDSRPNSREVTFAPDSQGFVADVARVKKATKKFADIIGHDETKRRLLEAALTITKKPVLGEKPRNGVILIGPPGNGKTAFAEALAGELKVPFISLSPADVPSRYVGERSMKIKAAFERAIQMQPSLLFIDEIDSFLGDRDTIRPEMGQKEDLDIVNLLLTLMVDIRESSVVLLAATNRLDNIDAASIREGRFDFKVEIRNPNAEERLALLQFGLNKNKIAHLVDSEVLRSVANRWNGYSSSRLLAISEELAGYWVELQSSGTGKSKLEKADFKTALRRIQGQQGALPENVKPMSEIVLPEATIATLKMVASRLNDAERVERMGGTLPTGLLFYGPAGTGKTTVAKALAQEVGSAFLVTSGADLARDAGALEKIYNKAKDLRPAIIFIDEGDAVLQDRGYSQNRAITEKLLTLMDGANDGVKDVLWIAATNHPDQIDSALLRGGRFTEKVRFALPEGDQIRAVIEAWLSKRNANLSTGVDVNAVADLIGEQSIANIEAVLQNAVDRAIFRTTGDELVLNTQDLENACTAVLGDS